MSTKDWLGPNSAVGAALTGKPGIPIVESTIVAAPPTEANPTAPASTALLISLLMI